MEGIINACTVSPCVHMGYAYTQAAALHLPGEDVTLTCTPVGTCQALAVDWTSASQAG